MMQATISSKGQVTVPKAVREWLQLQAGDRVAFFTESDGTARIMPVTRPVTALKGCVPRPIHPLSLADMKDAITRGAR